MATFLGVLIILASGLLFWAGVIWLIVSLFRKASVKPPLGMVLLGMVLGGAGWILSIAGALSGVASVLNDEPIDVPTEHVSSLGTTNVAVVEIDEPNTPVPDPTPTLEGYISVYLGGKRVFPANLNVGQYFDSVRLQFRFENIGDKDIRAFTGTVRFNDLFGRNIASLSLTHDEVLEAGRAIGEARTIQVSGFTVGASKLADTEYENMRIIFEPKSIIFTDGTQIGRVE